MICMKCGTNCADTAKFCLSCGAPLTPTPIPSPTQPYAQPQIPQPQIPQPQQYAQIPTQPYAQQPVQPAYQQPYQAQPMPVPPPPSPSYYVNPPEKRSRFNIKDPGSILIILASILLAISCFIPFAQAKFLTAKKTSALMDVQDGPIILGGIILLLVFLFTNLKIGVYITSALVCFYSFGEIVVTEIDMRDDLSKMLVTRQSGYYLMIIATVILIIGNIVLLVNHIRSNEKRAIAKRAQMYQQR